MRFVLDSQQHKSPSDQSFLDESMYKAPIFDTAVQEMKSRYGHLDENRSSKSWSALIVDCRGQAEALVDHLIDAMDAIGWQTQNILLDPQERQTYSTVWVKYWKFIEKRVDRNN